jgi:hypothetical protein
VVDVPEALAERSDSVIDVNAKGVLEVGLVGLGSRRLDVPVVVMALAGRLQPGVSVLRQAQKSKTFVT